MRTLAIIPARGNSKGIPHKNIVNLMGQPLIAWTIQAAHSSGLSQTILSTDDDEIAMIGRQYGVEIPFKRPADLATDSARAIPVLQHSVNTIEQYDKPYDAIMMLQPTSPMRLAADIDRALEMLAHDETADSVISVVPVGGQHPARMKYLKENLLVDPPFAETYENQPRAELDPMFIRNGAIYLVRRNILMEQNSLKGRRCLGLVMPERRSVNIDTPFDLEFAIWLMSREGWENEGL